MAVDPVAPQLSAFIDVELALVELLADLATTDVTTPSDLAGALPFVRVTSIGGSDDRWDDSSRIDIDTFDAIRSDTKALAQLVHQRMLSWPHVVGAGVIDMITTDVSPNEVPWNNPAIRRYSASYKVTVRR